jgi:hypothetical protein
MLCRRLVHFFALVFLISHFCASAADVISGPEVIPDSATSVKIRWRTDVASGSRVSYGLSAAATSQHAEGAVTDSHEVPLTDLRPGTKYFFTFGTARKQLGSGEFTTSSSPVSAAAPASTSPATKLTATPAPASKSIIARILGVGKPAPSSPAPPTRETWGNPGSLPDHFARHGADFHAKDADDYARMAWEFRQRAKSEHLPAKVDETGVLRVFDPKSGAFAAYNRDGTTKTFFKPGSPGYFERQPGRAVSQ